MASMSPKDENIIKNPDLIKTRNWKHSCVYLLYIFCIVWLIVLYYRADFRDDASFLMINENLLENRCPGVLHYMTSGRWVTRQLTSQQRHEIDDFLNRVSTFNLPNVTLYERPDRKCGNLPYGEDRNMKYFRILCNPGGPTPCCFNNLCANKTVDECKGPSTYDLRSQVHSEYSTWLPLDKRCSVKLFDSESACNLLNGSTIFMVGDSLMRGLFTALIQIISGDFKTGALQHNIPKDEKEKCTGMYSYINGICGTYLDFQPTLCNGNLKLFFKYYGSASSGKDVKKFALELEGKQKSMIFVGIGLWDVYNSEKIIKEYLMPTLQHFYTYPNYSYWPKMLWASAHRFGIRRYPYKTVDSVHGKKFNDKMAAYLRKFNIPVFDTFSITENVMTLDGTHFGQGMNILKAQLYLNYVRELQEHDVW